MATIPEAYAVALEHFHADRLRAAEHICRQILDVVAQQPSALNLLGIIHARLGHFQAAADCFQRALAVQPNWAEPHGNLGLVLKEQGKLDEAAISLQRALQLKPDFVEAYGNLGHVFKAWDKREEAAACYRRALDLKPDSPGILCDLIFQLQQMCQWDDLKSLSERLLASVDEEAAGAAPASPFAILTLPIAATARQQLRCAQRRAATEQKKALGQEAAALFSPAPRYFGEPGKTKITVGYLSGDFHAHATAFLIAELIEKHDRDRFAIFGYSYGPDDGSPMRRRLVKAFDRFVDVTADSFADAARRIAADGVDILVDLKGYTFGSRTAILAHRPAPIQVNYLGYPGTMGASFIDYIVVDDFVVPADQQPFFTEKLVHLPGCYQVNDGRREIALRTPARSECGLPEEGFVFCSFNNNYKITAEVFDVWMRLLHAVPGSVLWLLEGNRYAPVHLRREAEARGIAPRRLVFAPRCSPAEHLARHRLADLFLDTFPVTAHTTASDALWAGCPLLTIAGVTFISRVAASLLRALGLPELIATSLADYEAAALRLARDPRGLGELRARLERNRATSPLFDAGQFARNLENAYRAMGEGETKFSGGSPP